MRSYCHTCKQILIHKTLEDPKYRSFLMVHFPKCQITTWNEKKREGRNHARLMNVPNEYIIN